MNILLLVNHPTAAKFYCEIFKRYNHNIYVPMQFGFPGMIGGEEIKQYRTMNNNDVANFLDSYNLYHHNLSIDALNNIFKIISKNFDIIITAYHINRELLKMISLAKNKAYFILWGDICNRYDFIHKNILETPNKYYLIANDYLINKYVPLYSIPENKYKFYQLGLYLKDNNVTNTCTHSKNEVVIIISRLHAIRSFYDIIVKIAETICNVKFHVFGVDNQVSFGDSPNVTLHSACANVEEIYENIKDFSLALNFLIHEDVLQYSPIEFATIGIPFLYPSHGALFKIIGKSDTFTYNNIDELCSKIKYLICDNNLDKHKDEYEKINNMMYNKYKLENLVDSYKDI